MNPPAKTFRDLKVWQKAHQYVLEVYELTKVFPKQETYGLASQMRRAAVSIPANIAEGFGKRTKPDKARFLNIAQGSLEESAYYLTLTQDLGYGQTTDLHHLADELGRMLKTYTRAILASNF